MKNLHDAVADGSFDVDGYWHLQRTWGSVVLVVFITAMGVIWLARGRIDRVVATADRLLRFAASKCCVCRSTWERASGSLTLMWLSISAVCAVLLSPLVFTWMWGMHAIDELKPYGVIVGAGIGFLWPAGMISVAAILLWRARGYHVDESDGPFGLSLINLLYRAAAALLFLFGFAVVIESGACPENGYDWRGSNVHCAGQTNEVSCASAGNHTCAWQIEAGGSGRCAYDPPSTCKFSFIGASFLFLTISLLPTLQLCSRMEPLVAPLWNELCELKQKKQKGSRQGRDRTHSNLDEMVAAASDIQHAALDGCHAGNEACKRAGRAFLRRDGCSGCGANAGVDADSCDHHDDETQLDLPETQQTEELALMRPANQTPGIVLYSFVLATLCLYSVVVLAAAQHETRALGIVTSICVVALDVAIYMFFLGGIINSATTANALHIVCKFLLAAFGEAHWFVGHCFLFVLLGAPLSLHLVRRVMREFERPSESLAAEIKTLRSGSQRARERLLASEKALTGQGTCAVFRSAAKCLVDSGKCLVDSLRPAVGPCNACSKALGDEDEELKTAFTHPGVTLLFLTCIFCVDLAFVGPLTLDVPHHKVHVFGGSYDQVVIGLVALSLVLLGTLVHLNFRVTVYRAGRLHTSEDKIGTLRHAVLLLSTWTAFIVCGAIVHSVSDSWIVFTCCAIGPLVATSITYSYGLWASNGFKYASPAMHRVDLIQNHESARRRGAKHEIKRNCCAGSGKFRAMNFFEAFVRGGATTRDYRLTLSVVIAFVSIFGFGAVLDDEIGWAGMATVGYILEFTFLGLAGASYSGTVTLLRASTLVPLTLAVVVHFFGHSFVWHYALDKDETMSRGGICLLSFAAIPAFAFLALGTYRLYLDKWTRSAFAYTCLFFSQLPLLFAMIFAIEIAKEQGHTGQHMALTFIGIDVFYLFCLCFFVSWVQNGYALTKTWLAAFCVVMAIIFVLGIIGGAEHGGAHAFTGFSVAWLALFAFTLLYGRFEQARNLQHFGSGSAFVHPMAAYLHTSPSILPAFIYDPNEDTLVRSDKPIILQFVGLLGLLFWGLFACLFLSPPSIGLGTMCISFVLMYVFALNLRTQASVKLARALQILLDAEQQIGGDTDSYSTIIQARSEARLLHARELKRDALLQHRNEVHQTPLSELKFVLASGQFGLASLQQEVHDVNNTTRLALGPCSQATCKRERSSTPASEAFVPLEGDTIKSFEGETLSSIVQRLRKDHGINVTKNRLSELNPDLASNLGRTLGRHPSHLNVGVDVRFRQPDTDVGGEDETKNDEAHAHDTQEAVEESAVVDIGNSNAVDTVQQQWGEIVTKDDELKAAFLLQARFVTRFVVDVEKAAASQIGPLEEDYRRKKEKLDRDRNDALERKRILASPLQVSPEPVVTNLRTSVFGRGNCMVEWDPPKRPFHPEVVRYEVKSSPGGLTLQAGPNQYAVTYSGLPIGRTYTFTVKALPSQKQSASSKPTTIFKVCPKKVKRKVALSIQACENQACEDRQQLMDDLSDIRAAHVVETRNIKQLQKNDTEPGKDDWGARWLRRARDGGLKQHYDELCRRESNETGMSDAKTELKVIRRDYWIMGLTDRDGASPLHIAAGRGFQGDVNFLLTEDTLVDPGERRLEWLQRKDHNGLTPLHWAARGGHEECVKQFFVSLIDEFSVYKESTRNPGLESRNLDRCLAHMRHDNSGHTPADLARLNGHIMLADKLAKVECDIDGQLVELKWCKRTSVELNLKESLVWRSPWRKNKYSCPAPPYALDASVTKGGAWASKTFYGLFGDPFLAHTDLEGGQIAPVLLDLAAMCERLCHSDAKVTLRGSRTVHRLPMFDPRSGQASAAMLAEESNVLLILGLDADPEEWVISGDGLAGHHNDLVDNIASAVADTIAAFTWGSTAQAHVADAGMTSMPRANAQDTRAIVRRLRLLNTVRAGGSAVIKIEILAAENGHELTAWQIAQVIKNMVNDPLSPLYCDSADQSTCEEEPPRPGTKIRIAADSMQDLHLLQAAQLMRAAAKLGELSKKGDLMDFCVKLCVQGFQDSEYATSVGVPDIDTRDLKSFEQMRVGDLIMIPGGWTHESGGHAVMYTIERFENDRTKATVSGQMGDLPRRRYGITVSNTGDGVFYHPSQMPQDGAGGTKQSSPRYRTSMTLWGIAHDKLCDPTWWFLLFQLRNIPRSKDERGPHMLYEVLLPHIVPAHRGRPLFESGLLCEAAVGEEHCEQQNESFTGDWATLQRSGFCYFKCVSAALKYVLKRMGVTPEQRKHLSFALRVEALRTLDAQLCEIDVSSLGCASSTNSVAHIRTLASHPDGQYPQDSAMSRFVEKAASNTATQMSNLGSHPISASGERIGAIACQQTAAAALKEYRNGRLPEPTLRDVEFLIASVQRKLQLITDGRDKHRLSTHVDLKFDNSDIRFEPMLGFSLFNDATEDATRKGIFDKEHQQIGKVQVYDKLHSDAEVFSHLQGSAEKNDYETSAPFDHILRAPFSSVGTVLPSEHNVHSALIGQDSALHKIHHVVKSLRTKARSGIAHVQIASTLEHFFCIALPAPIYGAPDAFWDPDDRFEPGEQILLLFDIFHLAQEYWAACWSSFGGADEEEVAMAVRTVTCASIFCTCDKIIRSQTRRMKRHRAANEHAGDPGQPAELGNQQIGVSGNEYGSPFRHSNLEDLHKGVFELGRLMNGEGVDGRRWAWCLSGGKFSGDFAAITADMCFRDPRLLRRRDEICSYIQNVSKDVSDKERLRINAAGDTVTFVAHSDDSVLRLAKSLAHSVGLWDKKPSSMSKLRIRNKKPGRGEFTEHQVRVGWATTKYNPDPMDTEAQHEERMSAWAMMRDLYTMYCALPSKGMTLSGDAQDNNYFGTAMTLDWGCRSSWNSDKWLKCSNKVELCGPVFDTWRARKAFHCAGAGARVNSVCRLLVGSKRLGAPLPADAQRTGEIATEDDVLHSPYVTNFGGMLSEEESEALLCSLTTPYTRIPLVLQFFSQGRADVLVGSELQQLFEVVLFTPCEWASASWCARSTMKFAPAVRGSKDEPEPYGTPHGVLFNELRMNASLVLEPFLKIIHDVSGLVVNDPQAPPHAWELKDSEDFQSAYAGAFLFILRTAVRVQGYIHEVLVAADDHPSENTAAVESGNNEDVRPLEFYLSKLTMFVTSHAPRVLEQWISQCQAPSSSQDKNDAICREIMAKRLWVHLAFTESNTAVESCQIGSIANMYAGLGFWMERHTHNSNIETKGSGSFADIVASMPNEGSESYCDDDCGNSDTHRFGAGLMLSEHDLVSMFHARRWVLSQWHKPQAYYTTVMDSMLSARDPCKSLDSTDTWRRLNTEGDNIWKKIHGETMIEINLQTAEIFSSAGNVRAMPENFVKLPEYREIFGFMAPPCTPGDMCEYMEQVKFDAVVDGNEYTYRVSKWRASTADSAPLIKRELRNDQHWRWKAVTSQNGSTGGVASFVGAPTYSKSDVVIFDDMQFTEVKNGHALWGIAAETEQYLAELLVLGDTLKHIGCDCKIITSGTENDPNACGCVEYAQNSPLRLYVNTDADGSGEIPGSHRIRRLLLHNVLVEDSRRQHHERRQQEVSSRQRWLEVQLTSYSNTTTKPKQTDKVTSALRLTATDACPVAHIFDIAEVGRVAHRVLVATSDRRKTLHEFAAPAVPRQEPLPPHIRHFQMAREFVGARKHLEMTFDAPSCVIERCANDVEERFVPSKFLRGILPDALLENFRFWRRLYLKKSNGKSAGPVDLKVIALQKQQDVEYEAEKKKLEDMLQKKQSAAKQKNQEVDDVKLENDKNESLKAMTEKHERALADIERSIAKLKDREEKWTWHTELLGEPRNVASEWFDYIVHVRWNADGRAEVIRVPRQRGQPPVLNTGVIARGLRLLDLVHTGSESLRHLSHTLASSEPLSHVLAWTAAEPDSQSSMSNETTAAAPRTREQSSRTRPIEITPISVVELPRLKLRFRPKLEIVPLSLPAPNPNTERKDLLKLRHRRQATSSDAGNAQIKQVKCPPRRKPVRRCPSLSSMSCCTNQLQGRPDFEVREEDEVGGGRPTWRLYCDEHDGLFLTTPRVRELYMTSNGIPIEGVVASEDGEHGVDEDVASHSKRYSLPRFLKSMPHALVLQDKQGNVNLLTPNCIAYRPVVKKEPFCTTLHLERKPASSTSQLKWLASVDKPYYIYGLHSSGTFLLSSSVGSSVYLAALSLLHRDYESVIRLLDSCHADLDDEFIISESGEDPHHKEKAELILFFSQVWLTAKDDHHPDAHACRLKLGLLAREVGLDALPKSYKLLTDLSGYLAKLSHVSGMCRLTLDEEKRTVALIREMKLREDGEPEHAAWDGKWESLFEFASPQVGNRLQLLRIVHSESVDEWQGHTDVMSGGRWVHEFDTYAGKKFWEQFSDVDVLGTTDDFCHRPHLGQLRDAAVGKLLQTFVDAHAVVNDPTAETGGILTLLAIVAQDLVLKVGERDVSDSFVKLVTHWIVCYLRQADKLDDLSMKYLTALRVIAPRYFQGAPSGEASSSATKQRIAEQLKREFPIPNEDAYNPEDGERSKEMKRNVMELTLNFVPQHQGKLSVAKLENPHAPIPPLSHFCHNLLMKIFDQEGIGVSLHRDTVKVLHASPSKGDCVRVDVRIVFPETRSDDVVPTLLKLKGETILHPDSTDRTRRRQAPAPAHWHPDVLGVEVGQVRGALWDTPKFCVQYDWETRDSNGNLDKWGHKPSAWTSQFHTGVLRKAKQSVVGWSIEEVEASTASTSREFFLSARLCRPAVRRFFDQSLPTVSNFDQTEHFVLPMQGDGEYHELRSPLERCSRAVQAELRHIPLRWNQLSELAQSPLQSKQVQRPTNRDKKLIHVLSPLCPLDHATREPNKRNNASCKVSCSDPFTSGALGKLLLDDGRASARGGDPSRAVPLAMRSRLAQDYLKRLQDDYVNYNGEDSGIVTSLSCLVPEVLEQYHYALEHRAGPCSVKELVAGLEALLHALQTLMQRDAQAVRAGVLGVEAAANTVDASPNVPQLSLSPSKSAAARAPGHAAKALEFSLCRHSGEQPRAWFSLLTQLLLSSEPVRDAHRFNPMLSEFDIDGILQCTTITLLRANRLAFTRTCTAKVLSMLSRAKTLGTQFFVAEGFEASDVEAALRKDSASFGRGGTSEKHVANNYDVQDTLDTLVRWREHEESLVEIASKKWKQWQNYLAKHRPSRLSPMQLDWRDTITKFTPKAAARVALRYFNFNKLLAQKLFKGPKDVTLREGVDDPDSRSPLPSLLDLIRRGCHVSKYYGDHDLQCGVIGKLFNDGYGVDLQTSPKQNIFSDDVDERLHRKFHALTLMPEIIGQDACFDTSRNCLSALKQQSSSIVKLLYVQRSILSPAHGQATRHDQEQLATDYRNGVISPQKMKESLDGYTVDPRFLVFEYRFGYILRTRQVETVRSFCAAARGHSQKHCVQQMIMGAGKTTVIAPMIALILADGKSLVVQCMPQALLDMNLNVMRSCFSAVLVKRIIQLRFSRVFPEDPAAIGRLRQRLLNARRERAVVCTTPVAIKSMMLKYLELMVSGHNAACGTRFDDDKLRNKAACADALASTMKLFGRDSDNNKGVLVMDEVDMLLHPLRSELNFPIGAKQRYPCSPDRWNLPMHLLDCVFWHTKQNRGGIKAPDYIAWSDHIENKVRRLQAEMSSKVTDGIEQLCIQSSPHFVLLSRRFYEHSGLKHIMARWLCIWFEQQEPFWADLGRCAKLMGASFGSSEDIEAFALKCLVDDADVDQNATMPTATKTSALDEMTNLSNTVDSLNIADLEEFNELDRTLQLLNLGREWLGSILPHILTKTNRVMYGLLSPRDIARNPMMSATRKMLAVPFVGKDVPSAAAEFANPEILIGLSILAYRHEGLRQQDALLLVKNLKANLMRESGPMRYRRSYRDFEHDWMCDVYNDAAPVMNDDSTVIDTLSTVDAVSSEPIDFGSLTHELDRAEDSLDVPASGTSVAVSSAKKSKVLAQRILPLNLFQPTDPRQMHALWWRARHLPNLIHQHLQRHAFETMQCQTQKLSASGQELGSDSLFDVRLGFSGTPSVLVPRSMGTCDFEQGSEGKIVHVLTSPKYVQHTVQRNWTVESLLNDIADQRHGRFTALIDTGALITGMTNAKVAAYLLQRGLVDLQGVVYLDELDRKMVLIRGSAEPIPFARCGLAPDKRFTFYDQVHTTGMDIEQSLEAKAVLTISKDMTLRDYAQGAWRMRGLGTGQTLHLYIGEEVSQLIVDNVPGAGQDKAQVPTEVVAYLIINSCRSDALQYTQLQMQDLAAVWRNRAFELLIQSKADDFGTRSWGGTEGNDVLSHAINAFKDSLDFRIPERAVSPLSQNALLRQASDKHREFLRMYRDTAVPVPAHVNAVNVDPLKDCDEILAQAARAASSPFAALLGGIGLDAEMESEREQEQEKQNEIEKEVATMTGRERQEERPWLIEDVLKRPFKAGSTARGNIMYCLNSLKLNSTSPKLKCSDRVLLSRNVAEPKYDGVLPRRLKNLNFVLRWGAAPDTASASVSIAEAAALRRALHVAIWRGADTGDAPPAMQLALASSGATVGATQGFEAKLLRDTIDAHRHVLRLFNNEVFFTWDEALSLMAEIEKSKPKERNDFLHAVSGARRRMRTHADGTPAAAVLSEPERTMLVRMHETATQLQEVLGNKPRDAFERLDENGDGTLSMEEFDKALRGIDGIDYDRVQILVKYADRKLGDADGSVSYHEFCDNILQLEPPQVRVADMFNASKTRADVTAEEDAAEDEEKSNY